MSAARGNILLKLGLLLVVIAAGAAAVLLGVRETALVAEVRLGPAVHAVAGSVEVLADHGLVSIRSEAAGRVTWISESLDVGKSFKAKEELVRLDDRDLQRRMADARREHDAQVKEREVRRTNDRTLELAERQLEDLKRLQQRKEVSARQLEEQERRVAEIRMQIHLAELAEAKAKADFESREKAFALELERMTIRAPADGTTQSVFVTEGSLIGHGAPIANFYYRERVVAAKIGEESFGAVRLGQPARVRLLIYGHQEFDAKVSKILPFADEQTQRYTVYLDVDLPPEKLIPNSTGEVTITVGERDNQPLVPRRAVINNEHVLVVKDGRVERRAIKPGYVSLNLAEVREGLTPGELVIVENLERFREGQRVKVEKIE